MIKEIKQWGTSLVIVFTKEDRKLIGIEKGDIIDFDIKRVESEGGKGK